MLLIAGTQWGKTQVGALRMKSKIHTYTDKEDNFLITSPTYKTLHQSTLPAFLKYMEDYGRYDNKFDVFRINGGGNVYCRTERDPDSIVGITNVKHIWGDEAGKYGLYFWENIQARADFCGCGIDLTSSPYSMNWIPKELIKPFEKGLRPDLEYITASSWENPYHSLHDKAKRDHKRSTMDPRRFDMQYGGQFGKMVGLVFDCFDEETHQCESIHLPAGTKYYGAIDWGYTDPFVLNIRAVTPSGHQFKVSEFYKTQMILADQITVTKQKMSIFNMERIWADPSRPDSIEGFKAAGITNIEPADNDIRNGLDAHYELLTSGKYKIFRGTSPHTVDEYSTYHYPEPEDLGPDDDSSEQVPVDQNNHCMDTERYLSLKLSGKSREKKAPKVPSDRSAEIMRDHEQRIKHLKKGKKQFPGSENW